MCRVKGVMADQEESLLQQLTEITQMMQEGQLVEGMAPEKKPQDEWKGKRLYFTHRKIFLIRFLGKKKSDFIIFALVSFECVSLTEFFLFQL